MTAARTAQLAPIGPGVYGDRRGRLHLDVPRLLSDRGVNDNSANRRRWGLRALWCLRQEFDVVIVAHVDGLVRQ